MDENKLFRAFERAKAKDMQSKVPQPQPETDEKNAPPTEPRDLLKLALAGKKPEVITDLMPKTQVTARTADLSQLKNTTPMSVASMKKNKLIFAGMKNKAVLNAYRELRIKLKQKSDGENAAILLTSVGKDENSILTALNLAISYSLDQKTSALVIDCNPYSNELSKLVTSKFKLGLTDYVDNEEVTIDQIIYQSGIDRVSVIPAGSNHDRAVELFSSPEMDSLLYELKNRYADRNIIVNSPPVLTTSEARVLTKYCDLTVLTVPYGKASAADIDDAVNAVGVDHVAGVIYQQ